MLFLQFFLLDICYSSFPLSVLGLTICLMLAVAIFHRYVLFLSAFSGKVFRSLPLLQCLQQLLGAMLYRCIFVLLEFIEEMARYEIAGSTRMTLNLLTGTSNQTDLYLRQQ
jgi:hypothetical protein